MSKQDINQPTGNDQWTAIYALIDHLIQTGIIDDESYRESFHRWKKEFENTREMDPLGVLANARIEKTPPPAQGTRDAARKQGLILLVDDVKFIRDLIRNSLMAQGFTNIVEADNGYDAIDLFKSQAPKLVLMDVEMKGIDGLETFHQMHAINPETPVIFMTGNPKPDYVKKAFQLGISDFLAKPLDINRLISVIAQQIRS